MVSESRSIDVAEKKLNNNFEKAVDRIIGSHVNVVITGMGKSGDIAKKIAAIFSSIGIFSYFLHPM